MKAVTENAAADDSCSLVALAESLDAPVDLFRGVPATSRIHPTQILCYTRSTAERLLASKPSDRDIHHRHVLIVALRGCGEVTIDTSTFALKTMQALLVFPFQFHHYSRLSERRITWLFITFECGDDTSLGPLRGSGPIAIDGPSERRLKDLLGVYTHCQQPGPPSVSLNLELLLGQLATMAQNRPRVRSKADARVKIDETLLDNVNAWVMNRIEGNFSLSELARAMSYSESHLRALFREKTGHSLGRHIRRLRLLRACQLLQSSNLRISEIATRCGFDSLYSFSRAFRRAFLATPSGYRAKMRSYGATR